MEIKEDNSSEEVSINSNLGKRTQSPLIFCIRSNLDDDQEFSVIELTYEIRSSLL